MKHKRHERKIKQQLHRHLLRGLSLSKAIELNLSEWCNKKGLELEDSTVEQVAVKIADFKKKMDTSNVVEVYSEFIHYIFELSDQEKVRQISDQEMVRVIDFLEVEEHRGGYFTVKSDFLKKFSREISD